MASPRSMIPAAMPPGMMAPQFNQQMVDTGNQMLQQQGVAPYQPLQSPYFSNNAVANHPQLTGALGGILGVLANMGPTPAVSGVGDGISRAAQGLAGGILQQRQFQQQQAMLPMQIAQNVQQYRTGQMNLQEKQQQLQQNQENFRRSFLPQPMDTKWGVIEHNPATGEVTPGLTPNQISNTGANNGGGTYAQLLGMFPDATPAEQSRLRGYAQIADQIPDPTQRQEHLMTAATSIETDRRTQAQFQVSDGLRRQQFQANELQRQFNNQMKQQQFDNARNDLIPQAVQTQMSIQGIMDNLDQVRSKIAPLKGQNWPGTFLLDRAKYAAGMAPKDSVLSANDIAANAVSQVQGGAMWMRAAGTRNPMVYQKAQEHIFDPWKDSPDLALDKIDNMKKNLVGMYNEAGVLGHKHNNNPTMMDTNGTVVDQSSGAPVNFNPNPMTAPGMGGTSANNTPSATSGGIQIIRDAKGRITGIK